MLADYNMEIREQTPRGDGIRHVDTPATIAKLRMTAITTYFWSFRCLHDKDSLEREFIAAADRVGIDVWVLVPPSECCSALRSRLRSLGRGDARLSRRHRNLKVGDGRLLVQPQDIHPDYTRTLRNAARQINPDLRFFPVLYHNIPLSFSLYYPGIWTAQSSPTRSTSIGPTASMRH